MCLSMSSGKETSIQETAELRNEAVCFPQATRVLRKTKEEKLEYLANTTKLLKVLAGSELCGLRD